MSYKKSLAKQLLMSSNFLALNKNVISKLGLETAALLSSFAEADQLSDSDGWFYQTIETVEKHTTLSRFKQDKCIEQLQCIGVLLTDRRGIPAKRYFKIEYDKLVSYLFASESQTVVRATDKQDSKKLSINKEISNKEIKYKNINIKEYSSSDEEQLSITDESEEFFERAWKLYPLKRGKGRIKKTKKKEIYKLGEEFLRAISRYKEEVEYKRKNGFPTFQYQNGSTFFNSGYEDFLDENFSPLTHNQIPVPQQGYQGKVGHQGPGGVQTSNNLGSR